MALRWTRARLQALAAGLGADVPFFLGQGPAVGRGTGTELSPMALPPYHYLLLNPGVPLSTRWVYENLDLARLTKEAATASWDPEHPERWVKNDLGEVAIRRLPELAELLERVRQAGALTQSVSGSGPTIFGLFATWEAAKEAARALRPIVSGLAGRGPGPHRPGDRQYLGESRMDDLKIFTGNANRPLAEKICKHLGITLGEAVVGRFSDGEISVEFRENVRGKDVYVIQPTCMPCNENLMELLVMMDALKRASARCVTAVVTYFAYARQDRKTAPRTPISAKLVADLITTAGANRMLTMDLHTGQIQGFFNIPVDHLYAAPVTLDYIRENFGGDVVVVSPDAGGVERARAFAKRLNTSLAIIDKRRDATAIKAMTLIGNVWGKEAIILDDMVTTGATLTMAAELLMRHGVRAVHACVTHPVMSRNAVSNIQGSLIKTLTVTDTIPLTPEAAALEKIRVLSVAPLLGEAIKRIHNQDSVSSLFV